MGLLEDLLEGTSAVADTLDKGSQALRQGQEGLEYTKERLDWVNQTVLKRTEQPVQIFEGKWIL